MDALAIFNSFEAAFWIVVGTIVYWNSRLNQRHRKLGIVASIWFVVFGVSDIFEVFSGAWWRPWPLLVLKAVCVIALMTCGVVYRQATIRAQRM